MVGSVVPAMQRGAWRALQTKRVRVSGSSESGASAAYRAGLAGAGVPNLQGVV